MTFLILWVLSGLLFALWRYAKEPDINLLDVIIFILMICLGPFNWALWLIINIDVEHYFKNPLYRKPK